MESEDYWRGYRDATALFTGAGMNFEHSQKEMEAWDRFFAGEKVEDE